MDFEFEGRYTCVVTDKYDQSSQPKSAVLYTNGDHLHSLSILYTLTELKSVFVYL